MYRLAFVLKNFLKRPSNFREAPQLLLDSGLFICKLTVAMCTYCCCTVYTLLFTFVQFVLYQQLLLEYSRMFLALCTVLFAFSTFCFDCGLWENDGSALACSFFIVSKNVRKQGILQIQMFFFDPSNFLHSLF